ncbi:hypothetical protein LB456_11925 [Psychroflexus sp. CAK57W]|uniref:hypothetical protein n=1 Tax=Psychroflexus curvus TaxID=2873595 RepID=UPI001CCB5BFD|nr:hypothetical protein [Psychroflexus curvus]MBZ9788167.1 hypothetical protein [Psychroflexus curvus]
MKKILLIISIFILGNIYSQTSNKKEILYDIDWKLMTMKEFKEKIQDRKFTYKLTENDTAYLGKIFLREEIGKISSKERSDLIDYLENISKTKIDSSNTIVLNFFFKPANSPNGSCIDNYTSSRKYRRYFKKRGNLAQFFIAQKGFKYEKNNVIEDKNRFIRNLLFKYYFSCGNYIIIKSNGDFLRRLGEYRQSVIPKKIDSQWDES